jgi:uncharacterized protein YaaN involved in tellurite resistance
MSTQNAQDTQVGSSSTTTPASTQVFKVTQPEAIATGKTIYDELNPDEKQQADAASRSLTVSDAMSVVDFAAAQQNKLVDVAKEVTAKAKLIDTGKVGESALALKKAYEKIEVGKLRTPTSTSLLSKMFGKRAEKLDDFIRRQGDVSKLVDSIFAAQVEEEQALRQHYGVVMRLQEQNMQAFQDLTIQVAAAEQALRTAYEEAAKMAEENAGSTDPRKIRELKNTLKGLEVLNHRVLTLKTARFEAINSATIMDIQLDGLVQLVGMIRNSHTVMRQVWENQISLAITNAKMAKGTLMLQENREFMNKMMSSNVEDLAATAAAIQTEMTAGVVDIGVLEAVAQRTMSLQSDIVARSAEIQKGLQEQGRKVDSLVSAVQASTRESAQVLEKLKNSDS